MWVKTLLITLVEEKSVAGLRHGVFRVCVRKYLVKYKKYWSVLTNPDTIVLQVDLDFQNKIKA